MGFKVFRSSGSATQSSELAACFLIQNFLVCTGFQVLTDPETSTVPSPLLGRKDMVCTNTLFLS